MNLACTRNATTSIRSYINNMSRNRGSERLHNLHGILDHGSRRQSTSNTPKLSPSLFPTNSSSSALESSVISQVDETLSSAIRHGGCRFIVSPPVSQFDQPVGVRLVGLAGHAKVTLQAWIRSRWRDEEIVLVSHGHFYTDQQGNLDLDRDPSLRGSYTGVDPMGLFWSMTPLAGHRQDVRLVVKDVTEPRVINIAAFNDHIIPDDDTIGMMSQTPLTVTSVRRTILAPGVKRVEIREGRIRGTLFLPVGKGAHPGVIDMFGGGGGLVEIRAAMLAAHGFTVLSLAFMRFEDLPKKLKDVQFDYFEEAAEWFSRNPLVKTGGIGVVGVSGGASQALLMAIQCPQVKVVVAINGPPYQIVGDFLRYGQVFKSAVPMDMARVKLTKDGYIGKYAYVVTDADFFPVWKSQAHVLCLMGEDDNQAAWQHAVKLRDLYPAHQRHLIDVVVYPGAGHLLEPPYSPLCRHCYTPMGDNQANWGGEPKPHAVAQLDAWRRTLTFLGTWLNSTDTALSS